MKKLLKRIAIIVGVLFALLIALGIYIEATSTPEEKAARQAKIEADRAAAEAKKAQEQAEKEAEEKAEAEAKAQAEAKAKAEAEKAERLVKEQEEAEKAKQAELAKYFSAWDGSNRELVELVKANMNDPDSFEHVETRFKDHGDGYRIVMTFRGKNAFNATITQQIMARLNKQTRQLTEVEMVK